MAGENENEPLKGDQSQTQSENNTVQGRGNSSTPINSFAAQFSPNNVVIEQSVIGTARVALMIAYGAFLALVAAILLPPILSSFFKTPIQIGFEFGPSATSLERFFSAYMIHILLTLIVVIALISGHRMVSASGANPDVVIPPQDYPLLGPLVSEGKSDAVDIYVKLSSLRGVTGFFTKLGLTGLPLATITLTLIFSVLALVPGQSTNFLDLAKLTLGAFIGSFVQRQVEKRVDQPSGEAKVPKTGV